MKKILTILLVLTMCFSLCACGGGSNSGNNTNSNNENSTPSLVGVYETPSGESVITLSGDLTCRSEVYLPDGAKMSDYSGTYTYDSETMTMILDGSGFKCDYTFDGTYLTLTMGDGSVLQYKKVG